MLLPGNVVKIQSDDKCGRANKTAIITHVNLNVERSYQVQITQCEIGIFKAKELQLVSKEMSNSQYNWLINIFKNTYTEKAINKITNSFDA